MSKIPNNTSKKKTHSAVIQPLACLSDGAHGVGLSTGGERGVDDKTAGGDNGWEES